MEEQAATLLATLRKSSITVDAKLAQFNSLKSNIKHQRVPDGAHVHIFECIRLGIGSQVSPSLVSAGFATLGHFIKRLSVQDQTHLVAAQAGKLLPLLLDRLGDSRESHRIAASQCLTDLWPIAQEQVERVVRDSALRGTNARAKEMAMTWLVKMNKAEGLQFRSYVPYLVACLEDPDAMVRETAKSTVVELFSNAPEHAKADLKKQMNNLNVRKSISQFIISHLGVPGAPEPDLKASTISANSTEFSNPDNAFGDSMMSEHPPPAETATMEPLYVHTQRELDDHFRDMLPHFEGKETEGNWIARDKSVFRLRRLTKGNAPSEFHTAFMAGIKSMLDGIIKVANSLRTTMSSNGCQLVQELARTVRSSLDPMTEILLQNFVKMTAATKHISAQNGNVTVDTIFSYVSYNARLLHHTWLAVQDKNVQPRTYATGWLKTIIKRHASHKSQIEHTGGVDIIEKCIKKSLADPNPKVRENSRSAFWVFHSVWLERASVIMNGLDAKSKANLEKDPNNPNKSLASSAPSASEPKATFSRSVGGPGASSRSTLREAIAAQKKQRAVQIERPNSAQSALSTSAEQSSGPPRAGTRPGGLAAPSGPVRPGGPTTGGSLMSGPIRRPRRPELARPATAEPFGHKRIPSKTDTLAETPSRQTPSNSPPKDLTSKRSTTLQKSATRGTTRPPSKIASPTTTSPVRSKSRVEQMRKTPLANRTMQESPGSSPSKDENLTMVVPFTRPPKDDEPVPFASVRRPAADKHMSVDSGIPSVSAEDEGFTMVLPNMKFPLPGKGEREQHQQQDDRPFRRAQMSPTKAAHSPRLGSPLVSPVRSMARSPRSPRSPERVAGTPPSHHPSRSIDSAMASASHQESEEVKVYEDPFTGGSPPGSRSVQRSGDDKPALEELPLNERAPPIGSGGSPTLSTGSHTLDHSVRPPSPSPQRPFPGHAKNGSTGSTNGAQNGGFMTVGGDRPDEQKRTEILKSRRLLSSGIERIRARSLDAHGFRRLQDLVKTAASMPEIWGENATTFGALLMALLDFLKMPLPSAAEAGDQPQSHIPVPSSTATPSSAHAKALNLRTQTLSTLRALLSLHRRLASSFLADPVLPSLLRARANADPASHFSVELDRVVDEVVRAANRDDALEAMLALLDSGAVAPESMSEADKEPLHPRTQVGALRALGALLSPNVGSHMTPASHLPRPSSGPGSAPGSVPGSPTKAPPLSPTKLHHAAASVQPLAQQQTARIGKSAVRLLGAPQPDVRQAVLEACLALHERVDGGQKDGFWRAVVGAKEGQLNLIMYYLARRGRR
ncbi:clasp N terminal-domain-containing protein [Lineolata rhizophorae]|uniref:Clasp N terminal-domain-containing protein n=1 Tax=Lineolata rhizophorae TaxID=578093 RepID=A0A6A6NWN2_9PEZI|nr:clasp N terminal-domain-containing protein [Lineolata rhizophorae]